jgi:hypothetical protein
MDKTILLILSVVVVIGHVSCEDENLETRNVNPQKEIEACLQFCSKDPREHCMKRPHPMECEDDFKFICKLCESRERGFISRKQRDQPTNKVVSNINKDCGLKCRQKHDRVCARRGRCFTKYYMKCEPDCAKNSKKKCRTQCHRVFKKVCRNNGLCRPVVQHVCKEKCEVKYYYYM